MLGKKVKEINNLQLSNGLNQITTDVQRMKPGIYFVRLNSGGMTIVEKVIIH
jgi:hypothetical protein